MTAAVPEDLRMTPMLKQYAQWKKRYPDCLLFFRMGDFYEMFFEDARVASSVLDITLTARDPGKKIPMAGVPFHSVDSYLERLVASGHKVAICEQVSEPDGRTLVDRQVVRVVTPGTFLPSDSALEGRLACVDVLPDGVAVALLNFATGRLLAGTLGHAPARSELAGFAPSEVLCPSGQEKAAAALAGDRGGCVVTPRSRDDFRLPGAARRICREWGVASLEGFGLSDLDPAAGCAAALLAFVEETQFRSARGAVEIRPLLEKTSMLIDPAAAWNLEVVDPPGSSLLDTLNRCRTAMGRRKMRDWLLHPLIDVDSIAQRQDKVQAMLGSPEARSRLQASLSACGDADRALSRIAFGSAGPRDLGVVRDTLEAAPRLERHLGEMGLEGLLVMPEGLRALGEVLSSALVEEPPRNLHGGGVIRGGFDPTMDGLRDVKNNEKEWLDGYLDRMRGLTGIRNMKIGFNKVFGYYLEVSKSFLKDVPESFTRKQTLVSAERFITEELELFEKRMLTAEGEAMEREEELFRGLCSKVAERSPELRALAETVAAVDVLASFAQAVALFDYQRPEVDYGELFEIRGGRHPMVENSPASGGVFTPNDVLLDGAENRIAIVTGPNMAGKSTYLRMAALLAIMAQAGSFIPVESARMGIVERVFSRIGARDEIARGRSTFMVEMIETADILNNVNSRSLVILDEVGRGTSTYDGMSIAWAVLEYLQGQPDRRPKVLFATHFHELTALSERLPGVKNLSMAVKESGDGIVFLYKVIPAPADRSYGIEVARLAGIPERVLQRSMEILEEFEKRGDRVPPVPPAVVPEGQLALFGEGARELIEELAEVEPDGMTPIQALKFLYFLKDKAAEVLKS
ncbi:MAG: DNA mismatch repair protein MutS [Synergistetes bacterium ADurb.Bin155]|jgi:DNA mismatch repair protein MutS|nr:DNA mismatch repair protein MutS [Synergistales bacterium]MBP8995057.1 DNA mismatch repair protein MutS [Synergistales bacterium]NMD18444.1 DNA mismatch repair protein MutS [Synergistaceae bacterium]OQB47270.1 MAG: DNA mismatch repair protein MutS [Synergistetes bacterium ADurb.Bin155]HQL01971.1 DNA mismatch repair protein MutS [Synergistales bacterium]